MEQYERITTARLFLRNAIFNNATMVETLMNHFRVRLPILDISYNEVEYRIELKVKKTELKKDKTFIHSTLFYYPAIVQSYISFFNDPNVYAYFIQVISGFNEVDAEIAINIYENVRTMNQECASMLFNSMAVLDNILIIYL